MSMLGVAQAAEVLVTCAALVEELTCEASRPEVALHTLEKVYFGVGF